MCMSYIIVRSRSDAVAAPTVRDLPRAKATEAVRRAARWAWQREPSATVAGYFGGVGPVALARKVFSSSREG